MIGWITSAINSGRRDDNPPRSIPASIFVQSSRFGVYTEGSGRSGSFSLPFDLLIDESHEIDFDVSDHAVENGAVISDHISPRPRSVEVTGLFTNHPVGESKAFDSYGVRNTFTQKDMYDYSDSVELVDTKKLRDDAGNFKAAPDNVTRRFDSLKSLAKSRSKVRIVTALEIYDEMVIESLSWNRGPEDGESIRFRLRLRQVRTATVSVTERTGVWDPQEPETSDSAEKRAMKEEKKDGKVTGVEKKAADYGKTLDKGKGGFTA